MPSVGGDWSKISDAFARIDEAYGPYRRAEVGWDDQDDVLATAFRSRKVSARGYPKTKLEHLDFEPAGSITIIVSGGRGQVIITKAAQPVGAMLPFPESFRFSEVEFNVGDLLGYCEKYLGPPRSEVSPPSPGAVNSRLDAAAERDVPSQDRAPAVKSGHPPSESDILDKADEMKQRGLTGREIAGQMRHEPGFENVGTCEVRALIIRRWKPSDRPKRKVA